MLGDTLKYTRECRNLTQEQVANQLGISRSQYANYENNRSKFPIDLLLPFTKIVNYSADYILNFEHESQEGYNNRFKSVENLANFTFRSELNKDYVLWLSNEFEGNFDGVVMMAVAYACMPPNKRKHISHIMWDMFKVAYDNHKTVMPELAHKLIENEDKYHNLWMELDNV